MNENKSIGPESSAVRVALWRALHVEMDPAPHVFEDMIGLQMVAPEENWRRRGDMDPQRTSRARASIVARARYIEDLVSTQAKKEIHQYVILGAGIDTFAQRKIDIASKMQIFEIDQLQPQTWKQQRLKVLGFGIAPWLHFVPVDFEAGQDWWKQLINSGFDPNKPTIVASTGVAMYLTKDTNASTMRSLAKLPKGSMLAMSFMLPIDLLEPQERPGRQAMEKGAQAAGTPFVSYYSPDEIKESILKAGFKEAKNISTSDLTKLYFSNRTDGLRPSSSEELMIATV